MKLKRMLACAFIVAAFPLLASQSQDSFVNPAPFASVAFAGHSSVGSYYCNCGCPNCICGSDETPGSCPNGAGPAAKKSDDAFSQGATPDGAESTGGIDFGSGAMMLALAVFVWARFLRS